LTISGLHDGCYHLAIRYIHLAAVCLNIKFFHVAMLKFNPLFTACGQEVDNLANYNSLQR
jgi:hypothetical protein